MSYTKGPWRKRTKALKHHIRTDIQAKIGNSWKTLFIGNYYANEEDNARLIAAAPDMIEALEAIEVEYREVMGVSLVENYSSKRDRRHQEQYRKVYEAITKAKGGQP